MKLSLLIVCFAAVVFAAGCAEAPAPKSQAPPITDTKPLGDGIKTLAYALLGASVVITLGRLLR